MKIIYSIGIYLFRVLVSIASLFNEKARLLNKGQQQAFRILKEKVEPNAQYVWFHAASLGEFEQGRPVIEQLKKENQEVRIYQKF